MWDGRIDSLEAQVVAGEAELVRMREMVAKQGGRCAAEGGCALAAEQRLVRGADAAAGAGLPGPFVRPAREAHVALALEDVKDYFLILRAVRDERRRELRPAGQS